MDYNKTEQPRTQTILSVKFIVSPGILYFLSTLDFSGPEGKWARAFPVKGGSVTVYGPEDVVLGVDCKCSFQVHHRGNGNKQNRVIFGPLREEDEVLGDIEDVDLLKKAARFLGACDETIDKIEKIFEDDVDDMDSD